MNKGSNRDFLLLIIIALNNNYYKTSDVQGRSMPTVAIGQLKSLKDKKKG